MKQVTKFFIPVILLTSFQNVFGQNDKTQNPETDVYQAIANSEFDFVVRINRDMNEEELKTRIDALHIFNEDIKIDYSRDESGNIKTLSSSGSGSSCMSENFGFLIISLKDSEWMGCIISDNK
ncbi:hypothetical protein FK178_10265 [Antarcticibacterium arcticum]|uniref:Uncharacterized protein n=1 Tax=Antarcticibacterium arcticum TaxID=2585771 RepID=A0A5B8YN84_9FLAO|nr:hypothetical protein [Antarcticibacterium arcticum]QED38083.1 hypothetical protein FK178_10265 [Antarcticibacterium arcticum]